jgi:hypothetical protein
MGRESPAARDIEKEKGRRPQGVIVTHPKASPALLMVLALLTIFSAQRASAAVPVRVVRTDLKPLIRAAYRSQVQFAVLIPHAASAAKDGKWSVEGDRAIWRYAVQVPTAVSMSFHAAGSSLPASATLIVKGEKTSVSYRARDLHRGELWSRVHPGAALQLTLTVAAADRARVALNIVSLQAGYRSLGAGVADHPYYRRLKARDQPAQSSDNSACVTNYECQVTPANTPAGAATVALLVENLWECTGSLINDVPGDSTPYVLTARHCETGQLGGGNPGAAAAVTVYWDAITACGSPLASIYDASLSTQTGAQTIVEQQDAWLIKLDVSPVVADAQFSGFDASGGAVQGGYTIDHAEGFDKQFVEWYGQAYATQISGVDGTKYVSTFLETVNQLGNGGPGASGGGLFDQNNHLVGSLTGGPATSDPSGYGSCPVTPLAAPNGSNTAAFFTALAPVWNSTADTTSSTGSVTLQSVLDPANTGTLVVDSMPAPTVSLVAEIPIFTDGEPDPLTWNAPNATQCTAGGGLPGDGWSGAVGTSGTQAVTETASVDVTYTLSCTYSGGRTATASTTVNWVGPTPVVMLTAPYAVWTTRPAQLSWSSNVPPCSLAGGGLALSNLSAVGSTTATQSVATDVTYTVTCGPANNQSSSNVSVMYVTPSVTLEPTGTDRILGQTFELKWLTYADVCTPSGGAPNDGWSNNNSFNVSDTVVPAFFPQVTTVGTYTYTLNCTSGPISASQSVTVAFEQNAPYTTSSIAPLSVTYSDSPADYVTLSWDSNISSCIINTSPDIPYSLSDPLMIPYQAQGSAVLNPPAPGTYSVSVTCAIPGNTPTEVTSTPQTLTVLPPPAPAETLTITPSTVIQGQQFTVAWSSTNASRCVGSGGVPSSGWDGSSGPPSGTFAYAAGGPSQTGQFTFTLTCESIATSVASTASQAQLTVEPITDNLTITPGSVTTNQSFTLAWTSTGASSCSAGGGGADGTPWSGTLTTSGSAMQTATEPGTYTYAVTCAADGYTTQAQAMVSVAAASTGGSGGGSGGGGGGGGGLDLLELGSLAALAGWRVARRRRLGQQERPARRF